MYIVNPRGKVERMFLSDRNNESEVEMNGVMKNNQPKRRKEEEMIQI